VRRRWAVVGLAFALAAFGLGVVETRVLSIGLGWRAVYPNWLFNLTWRYGQAAAHDRRVLLRRMDALESREEARALLGAVLGRSDPNRSPFRGDAQSSFARLVAMAAPSGDLAARLGQAFVVGASADGYGRSIVLSFPHIVTGIGEGAVIAVRVDQVLVGGVDVPFERTGDAFAGADGAWRGWSHGRSMASIPELPESAIDDDSPRVPDLQAIGEVVVLPFTSAHEWWTTDPALATESDPERWGLDVVRVPFVARGSRNERVNFNGSFPLFTGMPPVVSDRLAPFLGGENGFTLPPLVAASQPIACAVVGVAVGLAALLGIAVVRFATVSPWMLNVAACPRCRSCVRGPGTGLPERCPECGAEADPATVRYGLRVVVRSLAVLGGALVGLAVAALATFVAGAAVERVRASVSAVAWDDNYIATWLAHQSLLGQGIFAESDADPLRPSIRSIGNGFPDSAARAAAERAFALTIASGWQDAEAERAAAGRPPSMTERLGWYETVSAMQRRNANDDVGLVAACESMRDAWKLPGVTLPRAVRVGERIVPRLCPPYERALRALKVREYRPDRASPGWARLPDSPLGVATEVGSVACELEWRLAFEDDAEGSIDQAIGGVVRGSVRVLPNDGSVTVVTDPALNPLDGGATVTLEIRETGERDLVTITADDAAVGVALAGSWRLGGAGAVTALSVVEGEPVPRGPWVGLVSVPAWTGDANAGAFDGRPDEVVATFVPDPNAGPIELDASGIFSILWGAETTVRFRRVPPRGLDVVTRYELVP
ncbi:MAG: hypothetical protein JNM94_13995, partial [Phycisphaerae bacterium]|nr:hypothetical protein [Phycisphaerae bacterium]